MKKLYLLLITTLLTIILGLTEVKAFNGYEIIPFNPDPSLVTEWNVSEQGYMLDSFTVDTPILKVIIPEGEEYGVLTFDTVLTDTDDMFILWIFSEDNDFMNLEIVYVDSEFTTIWLGGNQSEKPTMFIWDFYINDGSAIIEDIYMYPDVYINLVGLNTSNFINLYSYNFEYEISQTYQLGYNDGWGEKNKMTDITFLIIGLIIFIIANILGFIYKNNLLTALSGLLWLLPIFLVDNVFIKIFSVIIMLITFLFSFKERGDYYV